MPALIFVLIFIDCSPGARQRAAWTRLPTTSVDRRELRAGNVDVGDEPLRPGGDATADSNAAAHVCDHAEGLWLPILFRGVGGGFVSSHRDLRVPGQQGSWLQGERNASSRF